MCRRLRGGLGRLGGSRNEGFGNKELDRDLRCGRGYGGITSAC